MPSSRGSNPSLTSLAWAARFFTSSATWEALECPMLVIGNMPEILGFIFKTHADFCLLSHSVSTYGNGMNEYSYTMNT